MCIIIYILYMFVILERARECVFRVRIDYIEVIE